MEKQFKGIRRGIRAFISILAFLGVITILMIASSLYLIIVGVSDAEIILVLILNIINIPFIAYYINDAVKLSKQIKRHEK